MAAEGTDDAEWTPIRQPLGIGAFGVNAWHGDEGDVVIEAHDEIPGADGGCAGHEELYVVPEGRARFVVDGDEIDGPPGTSPASRRNCAARPSRRRRARRSSRSARRAARRSPRAMGDEGDRKGRPALSRGSGRRR